MTALQACCGQVINCRTLEADVDRKTDRQTDRQIVAVATCLVAMNNELYLRPHRHDDEHQAESKEPIAKYCTHAMHELNEAMSSCRHASGGIADVHCIRCS